MPGEASYGTHEYYVWRKEAAASSAFSPGFKTARLLGGGAEKRKAIKRSVASYLQYKQLHFPSLIRHILY